MKLAACQIGWAKHDEDAVLGIVREAGFTGLEIAPTLALGDGAYGELETAARYARDMRRKHWMGVCSMQSLWYGISQNLFGPKRDFLLAYTKRAMIFAKAVGAGNLVFGCPAQRNVPKGANPEDAVSFFADLADYAVQQGVVLAIEANPPIYGTNYINTTPQALALARQVASPGFKVNLDVGTMIENGEEVAMLAGRVGEISHVHISEPGLPAVQAREMHRQLAALLRAEGYGGWVSVEMKAQPPEVWRQVASYVAEVFE